MIRAILMAGFVVAVTVGCSGNTQPGNSSLPLTSTNANGTMSSPLTTLDAARASISVGSASSPNYSDDFEEDAVGSAAVGWNQLSGAWIVCQPAGDPHAYCQRSAGIAIATVGSATWTNYEVDASVLHASSSGSTALLGRLTDSTHFYGLLIHSSGDGSVQRWNLNVYNGQKKTLAAGSLPTLTGQAADIRLVFAGTSITAYVGQTRLGAVVDSTYSAGKIGLYSSGSTASSFDDVKVTAGSSGSPSPTPTAAPTSSASPTAPPGTRTLLFDNNAGSQWQEASPSDGQIQQPTFSAHSANCVNGGYAPNCSAQSGAARFHITRSGSTVKQNPNGSWRSMELLTNNVLKNGGMYDAYFQTTNNSPLDKCCNSQNILWQDHENSGDVYTSFGVENKGSSVWSLRVNGTRWTAPYVQGESDTWEIQWRNASDTSGWLTLYRNGKQVYAGTNLPTVSTTAYDVVGFGVYEYDWETTQNSNATSEDITYNVFRLYQIAGPVSPLAR